MDPIGYGARRRPSGRVNENLGRHYVRQGFRPALSINPLTGSPEHAGCLLNSALRIRTKAVRTGPMLYESIEFDRFS
jgi:hypothetical protein